MIILLHLSLILIGNQNNKGLKREKWSISKMHDYDRKNLITFFIIAFAFSWLIWGIGVIFTNYTDINLTFWLTLFIIIIGAFGPSASAVWLTYRDGGKKATLIFLKRGLQIKSVPKLVWVAMFLIPLGTGLTGLFFANLNYDMDISPNILIFPLVFIVMYLGGSIQEEYGWRGYALDRLQARWNALNSSLILGVIWATWHLPLFYIKGTNQENMVLSIFYFSTLSYAIFQTWFYNNTNRNIFVAMTFHTIGNSMGTVVNIDGASPEALYSLELYMAIAAAVVALFVVLIWGPKKLVRESSKISSE